MLTAKEILNGMEEVEEAIENPIEANEYDPSVEEVLRECRNLNPSPNNPLELATIIGFTIGIRYAEKLAAKKE